MKKLSLCFIMLTLFVSLFAETAIDRGYLKLEGPEKWNDSYVIFTLTTDNSKGGTSNTVFMNGSYDRVLSKFEYDSKDWFKRRKNRQEILNKLGGIGYDYDETLRVIFELDDFIYSADDSLVNKDALNIIKSKANLFEKQLTESYIKTLDAYKQLSAKEKDLLQSDLTSSGVEVEWTRYVDGRNGFFTFKIYVKETDDIFYFRVDDSTNVYFNEVKDDNKKSYNNLDAKVLAICSEMTVNKTIVFAVQKSNVLQPKKDCGFVLIK